jgi:hypothetical protein
MGTFNIGIIRLVTGNNLLIFYIVREVHVAFLRAHSDSDIIHITCLYYEYLGVTTLICEL